MANPQRAPIPRQYTVEEVRERFLRHVWGIVDHWENESREPTVRGKLEGLAFSSMSALDGSSGIDLAGRATLPAFAVLPSPHPDDEAHCREHGENWFPSGVDIGPLHEHFFKYKPE